MAAHGRRMLIAMTSSAKCLIENNKGFRQRAKRKEQFPNEDSPERFACMVCCDCRRRFSRKTHRGFQDITILSKEGIKIGDATIRQVPALHGTYIPCGNAMGVLFEAKDEKTFYLAGDTIWYEEVAATIKKYQPEVIALNACAAETLENGRLIMNDEDVWNVSLAAPHARLYITHMNNVAHAALTRYTMLGRLASRGIVNYDMPADGESIIYLHHSPLHAEGSH